MDVCMYIWNKFYNNFNNSFRFGSIFPFILFQIKVQCQQTFQNKKIFKRKIKINKTLELKYWNIQNKKKGIFVVKIRNIHEVFKFCVHKKKIWENCKSFW